MGENYVDSRYYENFCRLNDGRVVEYVFMSSECRNAYKDLNWDDMVYLGFGEYSHSGRVYGKRIYF